MFLDVFPGGGTQDERGLEFFGERLEPGGEIDGLSDYRIFEAVRRTYIAGSDLAGVDANPDFEMRLASGFRGIPALDAGEHLERAADSAASVLARAFAEGRAEDDHDAVSDELVEKPAVLLNDFAHGGKVAVEPGQHLL